MNKTNAQISRLVSIRNRYGNQSAPEKIELINKIGTRNLESKKTLADYYSALLFINAYPDNRAVYQLAAHSLDQLQVHIRSNEKLQYALYNTGITGTKLCAAFSFEMVKWLRKTRRAEIELKGFDAADAQVQSILSVVMPEIESEILQDANAEWKGWLQLLKKPGEGLLDQLLGIFDSSDIRPEVKDELWNTIGIHVEIRFTSACRLPESLAQVFYHRSLIRKATRQQPTLQAKEIKLTAEEAEQIIDCSRMTLVRKLRELDPISFTSAKHVSFYHLPRGLSIVLTGMVPERRHPIDSYMGYLVFKNGLPVAYAGSWILFDSARIGLNVFDDYRGGEAKYIFEQVLLLHARVYGLKRFTVDPYQIGKENTDGIKSGAFWIYYHAGFRPLEKRQQELAMEEAKKIKDDPEYRSPASVLRILSGSRLQLVLKKTAVSFDATDLSRVFAGILMKDHQGNRNLLKKDDPEKLANMLQLKNHREANMDFILKNWAPLLLNRESELLHDRKLQKVLKKLFLLKAAGSEEAYINGLQKSAGLRTVIERSIEAYLIPIYQYVVQSHLLSV